MKKTLKESIQRTVKESILKEKWNDGIAAAASGITNSFKNIGGQYGLGKIQNRLDRVGARIEKDWNNSAKEVTGVAQKLTQSKNPMIAQQGQAFTQKIQGIENAMDQTLKLFNVPVGEQNQNGDEDAEFESTPQGKQFNQWLKKVWHGDPNKISVRELEAARASYREILSYKIDPLSPEAQSGHLQDLVNTAKARELQQKKLINKQHGFGSDERGQPIDIGDEEQSQGKAGKKASRKAAIKGLVNSWRDKNPNATKEEKEAFKQQIKGMMKGNKTPVAPAIAPKPPGKENEAEAVRRKMGLNPAAAPAPAAAGTRGPPGLFGPVPPKVTPQTPPAAKPAMPPVDEPSVIVDPSASEPQPSIKGMVGDGNWGDPETMQKKPEMQSPANTKGKASPAPLPPNPNPYQSVAPPPPPVPLTKRKEAEPVPLTNLKPVAPKASATAAASYRPEDTSSQMPPEENVPSSIKGFLPPIKDDGNEIQVGSAEQPSFSPTEDILKGRPKSIEQLKAKAERTREPSDIEAWKNAMAKDTIKSKKPTQKKK